MVPLDWLASIFRCGRKYLDPPSPNSRLNPVLEWPYGRNQSTSSSHSSWSSLVTGPCCYTVSSTTDRLSRTITTHSLTSRDSPQGRVDTSGVCHYANRQQTFSRQFHLLHVLRFYGPRSHGRKTGLPCKGLSALEIDDSHLW